MKIRLKKPKYNFYKSANIMPIGRYILCFTDNPLFLLRGDEEKVLKSQPTSTELQKAYTDFNKTIVKNKEADEQQCKLQSSFNSALGIMVMTHTLSTLIDYCLNLKKYATTHNINVENELVNALQPLAPLLINFGVKLNNDVNVLRCEKTLRGFKEAHKHLIDSQSKRNKTEDGASMYTKFIENITLINEATGVVIDPNKSSVNHYYIALETLNKRLKNKVLKQKTQSHGKRY